MSGDHLLMDLLVSDATEGLSETERVRLEQLLGEQDDLGSDDLRLAAAAIDLAFQDADRPSSTMPPRLRDRILVDATSRFPNSPSSATSADSDAEGRLLPFRKTESPARPVLSTGSALGWYAAAAILAVSLLLPMLTTPGRLSPAEQRDQLIASSRDLLRASWSPQVDAYTGVRGDVVWSNQSQSGYMLLEGLPSNRPTAEQYQLWIVDPSRDEHPIDGGVFDIPAGRAEVVVPIAAKLTVDAPTVFAITLEKPGGVVVSGGPLLIVAPVKS